MLAARRELEKAPALESKKTQQDVRRSSRLAHIRNKYDDIFTSVVQKALAAVDPCWHFVPPKLKRIPVKRKKRRRRNCRKNEGDVSGRRPFTYGSADGLPLICEELSFIGCHCGAEFGSHLVLHEHMVKEHAPSPFAACRHCGVPEEFLRNNFVCGLCDAYSESLEDHLKVHYQDSTGPRALMECRKCCKKFRTVHEVRLHERSAHSSSYRPRRFKKHVCDYCRLQFESKHIRDTHLIAHFERLIDDVWERVEHMQAQLTDMASAHQCPVCYSTMGTRKAFRLHIVEKHLMKNPEEMLHSPAFGFLNPAVRQELRLWLPSYSCTGDAEIQVKKEVKQEIVD
ncbi:hypothetical protein Q1695_016139 [Nippostrongylus brasiliensis]|nr:hypothetical protein Q1695_016139 [Nippostrongylus brasiliensis]